MTIYSPECAAGRHSLCNTLIDADCSCQCHTGQLFDAHTHARTTDPDTSHAAAESLHDVTTMLRRLLTAYAEQPLTSEEAATACGYGPWATSKRVSDLDNAGLIADTGVRRLGSSGRQQMVRGITDRGTDVLAGRRPLTPPPKPERPSKATTLVGNPKAKARFWDAVNEIVRWYLDAGQGNVAYNKIRDDLLADLDKIRGE